MGKNVLYLECYEGITGGMVLEALQELAGQKKTERKDEKTEPGELSAQIDEVLSKLQVEKITASAVWTDQGPTDSVGLSFAARSKGECPERFIVKKVGIGRSYVNREDGESEEKTLRAMLIEEMSAGDLWILESNVDDCAGEILGYTLQLLLEAGARDAWFTPIFMKKNRPAYKLSILCKEEQIRAMDEILFRETTTIGVRRYRVERSALPRRFFEVSVPGGTISIKACRLPDGTEKCYPEYEDVKQIARGTGLSYREVYEKAKEAAACD